MKVRFALLVAGTLLHRAAFGFRIAKEKLKAVRQDIDDLLSPADTPHLRSLQAESDLSAKGSADASRRLQAQCVPVDDFFETCVALYPTDAYATVFETCPQDSDTVTDCLACTIYFPDDLTAIDLVNDPQCTECSVCAAGVVPAAFDCTNIATGECAQVDCDGNCVNTGSVPSPTSSPPSTTTVPPTSSSTVPPPSSTPPTDLNDPCTTLDVTTTRFSFNGFTLWKPSFYEQCAESVVVNPNNMLLHLTSLRDIFKQYHCFYDIAKDPSNSDPISFQPELGNTVFGADGGAVNLEVGLQDIAAKVTADGASMATFWEIEQLFHRLYDGHVDTPDVEQDFYSFFLIAIPQRFVGGRYDILTDFAFDENSRLQMKLTYADSTMVEELFIDTINGQSVHDFAVELANNPSVFAPLQSVGARLNFLLSNGLVFLGNRIVGKPLDVMPDTFQVTYVDGGEETFVTGIVTATDVWESFYSSESIDGETYLVFNRIFAEAFVNQPGEQFDAYRRAITAIDAETAREPPSRHLSPRAKETKTLSSSRPQARDLQFLFDEEIIPGVGAYSVQDGYVVMKLESFVVQPIDLAYLWTNATNAGFENGVTKLMIDLSSNGGGFVVSAYLLLFLLFPEVDLIWFRDQWDINYNTPMREFIEALIPIVIALEDEFAQIPNEDFQARIDAMTESDLAIYDIAASAMVELCQDADPTGEETPFQCEQVLYMQQNMTNFVLSPNLSTYVELFISLADTLIHYSPWSVVLELVKLGGQPDIMSDLLSAGVQTVIRGGVESNVTAKFDVESLELLQTFKSVAESIPRQFTEYLFVSNGLSASAGAIVPFEAAQLYKNRDRTGAGTKVTLCGYGGTGNPDDLVLSSIPASVQGVHLEDPIIGDAALQLFVDLLPTTLSNINEIYTEMSQYSQSVAIPPFYGDTLPKMPVINFYDRSMNPGALPLQFVRIPLDAYIPQVFTGVTFSDTSDLQALYELASNAQPVPTSTPGTDAQTPTTSSALTLAELSVTVSIVGFGVLAVLTFLF